MLSFEFEPDIDPMESNDSNVAKISFGDGYAQYQGKGINTNKRIFNLVFSKRKLSESSLIKNFLRDRNGTESFLFLPPYEDEPIKVICEMNSITTTRHKGNMMTITAKFEQVFG